MGKLTVLDNQEIGKLFMGTALIFFLLAGVMALVMRAQLAVSENHLVGPEVYNRLFTMHGSAMMYLGVVPLLEGLGIYLLPMMLGSRDVAFPYVTAFSYWTYLFGGVTFFLSFLINAWRGSKNGAPAPANPWQSDTLEWLLSSPAPEDNHRAPPLVHSRHPLWGEKSMKRGTPEEERVRAVLANTPKGWRIALVTSILEAAPTALQPWPKPSLVPFVISVGLEVLLLGTLFKNMALMVLGTVVCIGSLLKWYVPEDELLETLKKEELDKRSGLPLVSSGIQSMDGWGLLCCLAIVVTVYGSLFYSYYYTRLYSPLWPQDHLPRPHLLSSGLIFALVLLSIVPLLLAKRAFKADQGRPALRLDDRLERGGCPALRGRAGSGPTRPRWRRLVKGAARSRRNARGVCRPPAPGATRHAENARQYSTLLIHVSRNSAPNETSIRAAWMRNSGISARPNTRSAAVRSGS